MVVYKLLCDSRLLDEREVKLDNDIGRSTIKRVKDPTLRFPKASGSQSDAIVVEEWVTSTESSKRSSTCRCMEPRSR